MSLRASWSGSRGRGFPRRLFVVAAMLGLCTSSGVAAAPGSDHAPAVNATVQATAVELPPLPSDPEVAAVILATEMGSRVDGLEELLRDPEPALRARAALAAGRGGWPDRHATLLASLEDAAAPVRAAAAFSLGVLRYDLEPALAAVRKERVAAGLGARLADDPTVALAAAIGLGRLAIPPASLALGDFLTEATASPEVAAAALRSYERVRGSEADAVSSWLRHDDPQVRAAAARALIGTGDPNALPSLAPLLGDPDGRVRGIAVRGLRRVPSILERHVDELLLDREPPVAVATLGHLEATWDPAVESDGRRLAAVLRHSLDRDLGVRRAALAALGPLAPYRAAAADRLSRALEEPEPAVRAAALRALVSAGGEPADRGLGWAYARWRAGAAGTPPITGVEARALAEALAGTAREQDLSWLLELAGSPQDRLRQAAYPPLLDILPRRAMELARQWIRRPGENLAGWGIWGALQLHRSHGLPEPDARPGLVDDAWALLRSTASPREARIRSMALELIHRLAPEILQRRIEFLTRLPWPDLRTAILRLGLQWPVSEIPSTTTVDPESRRRARRALALQADPPRLRLSTPRGDADIALRPDWSPLAALDVVDRVAGPTGLELTVVDHVPGAGSVVWSAGEWPLQPEWPAATIPGLARPGMLRRVRPPSEPGGGTWGAVVTDQGAAAGEVWGAVIEGVRVLARLQPGDRVRIRAVTADRGARP